MENNDVKISTGIKVVSIIQLVGNGFTIINLILMFFFKDAINDLLKGFGVEENLFPNWYLLVSFIISTAVIVGLSMILAKNKIGVFMYFGSVLLSEIVYIIYIGVGIELFTALILPTLMAIFISKQKQVFFEN